MIAQGWKRRGLLTLKWALVLVWPWIAFLAAATVFELLAPVVGEVRGQTTAIAYLAGMLGLMMLPALVMIWKIRTLTEREPKL